LPEPDALSIDSPTAKDVETANADSGVGAQSKITTPRHMIRTRTLGLYRRSPGVIASGAIAVVVALGYLLAPPMGRDYSAQLAHAELFAAPIIVAIATVPLVAVIAATPTAVWLVPPVSITEVQERGDPALSAAYYAPLLDQLAARGTLGPIEVVPTQRRGEAALVAPRVAIARGWSRQADIGRNPIFYDGTLNAATYQEWLDDNAVSYVALSKGPLRLGGA
jgi:hypothetical protein